MPAKIHLKIWSSFVVRSKLFYKVSYRDKRCGPRSGSDLVLYTAFAEESSTSKSFQQIAKHMAFIVIIGALWAN